MSRHIKLLSVIMAAIMGCAALSIAPVFAETDSSMVDPVAPEMPDEPDDPVQPDVPDFTEVPDSPSSDPEPYNPPYTPDDDGGSGSGGGGGYNPSGSQSSWNGYDDNDNNNNNTETFYVGGGLGACYDVGVLYLNNEEKLVWRKMKRLWQGFAGLALNISDGWSLRGGYRLMRIDNKRYGMQKDNQEIGIEGGGTAKGFEVALMYHF